MAQYGHMAILGHMAIGPYATNMGKWGIPGKSYKNVAQLCCAVLCCAVPTRFYGQQSIFGHFPIEITIENFKWPAMDRFMVYNAEKKFVGSTHLVAPYIQKQGRNSKKVVLRRPHICHLNYTFCAVQIFYTQTRYL